MNRFSRYFLYRTVLFISVLGITIFFIKEGGSLFPLLIFLLLFIIDEILVHTLQKEIKLFNILIDSTYLSIFIIFTGGVYSPFAPFYFTFIVLSAYLLSPLDSFITAGYSGLLYGLICLVFPGYIPERLVLITLPPVPSLPDVLLNYIIYSLSFLFTAALSSFIVERFRREMIRLRVTTGDILGAIDYGILTIDDKRRIVWSNEIASILLDDDLEPGKYIDRILPGSFYHSLEKVFSDEKKEEEIDFRDRIYRIRRNELHQGQGTILLINDVTLEKQREEEIQMREKLITIGQFAANLAHSVRNPVSSIRASAELFDVEKGEYLDKNRRLKRLIIEESDHLDGLVLNFLDFTRGLEINPVEVHLRELCGEIEILLKKSKYFDDNISIENRVSDTIKIKADQALLRSVLLNLGTNSLKAMRNGGQLIFNCHTDGKIVIGVEDTGCGIPEKDIKRIFSPFYSRFNDGFGFGLAIVKKIIELHGWDCKVDSQLNKGTKFRIII